jgi:hypothetical protein
MGTSRWTRLQLLSALVAALVAGCSRVDVGQPIQLRAAPDIPASVLGLLGDAAESWNVEVGTQLVVVPPGSDPPGQRVSVGSSDLVCAFGSAVTRYTGEVDVQLCLSATRFAALLHELGHVINIHTHAEQASSAMDVPGSGQISEEDRQLFRHSNPSFEGAVGCKVVRHLAPSGWPPFPFASANGPAALVRDTRGLALYLLDEATAGVRELRAHLGDADMDLWTDFAAPGGQGVVWHSGGGSFLQIIDRQTLVPGAPVSLDTGKLEKYVRIIADAHVVGETLLLAIVADSGVELRRYQLSDGAYLGQPYLDPHQFISAEFHEAGGLALWKIPRQSSSLPLTVTRLDQTGAAASDTDWTLPSLGTGPPRPNLLDRPAHGEVLVATGRPTGGVRLSTVDGTILELQGSVDVQGPTTRTPDFVQLLPTKHGLLVSISATVAEDQVADVYAALVEESTGKLLAPWRRLSPPRGRPDQFPRAVETTGGALLLWTEGNLDREGDAIARCVQLP